MEDLRFELTRTAADLRAQLSAEPLTSPFAGAHHRPPVRARGRPSSGEMADALVAAVERLRARVAEVNEAEAEAQSPVPVQGRSRADRD